MPNLENLKLLDPRHHGFPARNKVLSSLDEQISSAKAMIAGESFILRRRRWITDANGERVCMDMPIRQKHWYWADNGVWFFVLRHGSRAIPLREGRSIIEVGTLENLVPTMEMLREALISGELDAAVQSVSHRQMRSELKKTLSSAKQS